MENEKGLPFLCLPPELRHAIYEIVTDIGAVHLRSASRRRQFQRGEIPVQEQRGAFALRQKCQQMRAEACGFFFMNTTWDFHVPGWESP